MLWTSALDTVWALLRTQICCSVGFSAGLDYSFPRIWCSNDRIDKCQWILCITRCITICCDVVNESGQVQLVLRHTWLWVVFNPLNAELNPICQLLALLDHPVLHVSRIIVNDAVSIRDCIVSNGGMNHYFERMWQIPVVGLICGTVPVFAWMTCCQPRISCQDILSPGWHSGPFAAEYEIEIIIAPPRRAFRTSCKADRPSILGRYELLEEYDMKYCSHSLQFS